MKNSMITVTVVHEFFMTARMHRRGCATPVAEAGQGLSYLLTSGAQDALGNRSDNMRICSDKSRTA
jgi:hypothetical protein